MAKGYCVCISPYCRYQLNVPENANAEEYMRRWARRTEIPRGACVGNMFIKLIITVHTAQQYAQIKEFIEFPLEYIRFKNCTVTNYAIIAEVTVLQTGEKYVL